jgi:hypothetical protein
MDAPLSRSQGTVGRRRTVVVGVGGLLGAGVAYALDGGLGVRAVALASPSDGLVDGLCRGVSGPVGVELGIVACGVVSKCAGACGCSAAYPAARRCSAIIVSCGTRLNESDFATPPATQRGVDDGRTLEAIVVILSNWSAFRALPF